MTLVRSLAYLGVRAPDIGAWRAFATEVLGVEVAAGSDDQRLLLRMDDRCQRLTVEAGEAGLAYLGFEVAGSDDLERLVGTLEAAGVAVKDEPGLAAERQVRSLVSCQDPAGNNIELVVGHLTARTPFVSPRGVRFKTGEQGLGHVFMIVPDLVAARDFYVDLLGFKLSDTIDFGFAVGTFLHCNPRHHTVALACLHGVSGLGHLMIEVDTLDAVGRAYDRVAERGDPVAATLGMHTNDHMVSFYVATPSGFEIEYGTQGRDVDDATWTVGHYDAPSFWGHKRQPVPTP